MADISILARLVNGALRNVDLTTNTPVVLSIKVGGVTNTELTKAILDRLVNLQNGSDVDATYHTHDGRYYQKSEINSASGTTGSSLVGDNNSYSNFTPAAATVKGALSGIDTALGTVTNAANKSLSNLTSPTSVNQDLIMQTGKTLRLPNNTWLIARNVGNTANINIVELDTSDRVQLQVNTISTQAGSNVFDVANRKSFDSSAFYSVDFQNRIAADSTEADSVDWQNRRLKTGATIKLSWAGTDIDVNTRKITSVTDPTNPQDAATKAYVDAVALGLTPKKAVLVATTANITLSGEQTIDGVLTAASRVLVKDQTLAQNNGIYVSAAGAWARSTDMDSLTPIDEVNGAWVPVQLGTVNAGRIFVEYSTVVTLGTDPISFEFYNPIASLIGGDMITVSGSTISVDLATVSGLESSNPGNPAGQLRVKLEASNPTLKITGSNELAVKLDAAGAIVSGAAGIAVATDGTTIEISSDALRVKDAGITLAKIASNAVDENKIVSTSFSASGAITGGSGTKVAWNPDGTSLEISSNAARIKSTAYDQITITGGSGSAAAVQQAPLVKRTLVAGEAFAANTSFLVRWALTGETAGRVYKADKDASSLNKYAAIGIALSTSSVSAGQNIDVVLHGEYTQGSSDTAFNAADVGKELFVGTTGAIILGSALANTGTEAAFCIGTIQTTTKIWVDQKTLRGISS